MEERFAEETQTLRELLAIMQEHDLEAIKVKLGDAVYELSRRPSERVPAADSFASAPTSRFDQESSSAAPDCFPGGTCKYLPQNIDSTT